MSPGRTAELAAALLWFIAKLTRQVGWRLTGHKRADRAIEVQNYLGRGIRRFLRVMARLAAGEVFRARASRAGAPARERAVPRLRLPMEYGWVSRLGEDVRTLAAGIGQNLNRADVSAVVAACPQAQRVLRPVCHLLGIDAPCVGRLLRRKRVRASARPAPRPSPGSPGEREGRRLTRREREAILWYPNLEGKPMTLLPKKLPRD